MKKYNQDTALFDSDKVSNKNLEEDKIKTTNVNILLNRVRQDRQKTLKKRIVITLFLAALVSSLAVYFVI